MLNIFAFYIMLLIEFTLLPIQILTDAVSSEIKDIYLNANLQGSFSERMGINYIPFYDYYMTLCNWMGREEMYIIKHMFITLTGNLFLLTPFIGYICLYNKKIRKVKRCVITALSISIIIEGMQFIENLLGISIPMRTININDLILNTLSGIIAFYIFRILYKTKLKKWLMMV